MRGESTLNQTTRRALECASCGYDLDDRVLVGVEVEVVVLLVAVQIALAVSARL